MDISTPVLLLIFVKWPEEGRVKTRLGSSIGMEASAKVCRVLVEELLTRLPSEASLRVVFSPPDKQAEFVDWLTPLLKERPMGTCDFRPQCGGDLGERLRAAFAEAFDEGHKKVGALGGDCLSFSSAELMDAMQNLNTDHVALGPSLDGGYWFLGLSERTDALFEAIPWSSPQTLAVTRQRIAGLGKREVTLQIQSDIDTLTDLQFACRNDALLRQRLRESGVDPTRFISGDPALQEREPQSGSLPDGHTI